MIHEVFGWNDSVPNFMVSLIYLNEIAFVWLKRASLITYGSHCHELWMTDPRGHTHPSFTNRSFFLIGRSQIKVNLCNLTYCGSYKAFDHQTAPNRSPFETRATKIVGRLTEAFYSSISDALYNSRYAWAR